MYPVTNVCPVDELGARLAEWAADARAADAAAERSRLRWLERQAVEDASLAGVVRDLAERGADASIVLRTGAARTGRLTSAGADFGVLEGSVVIPFGAMASIRSPRVGGGSARAGEGGLTLAAALSRLAGERPAVRVETDGGAVAGDLVAAGGDVLVLDRPVGFVPLAAVVAVVLL